MRRIATAITILIILLMAASPAMALSEPDDVDISNTEIFQDLLTTGDMLVVAPYSVTFTSAPTVGIDKTFIFRLMSPDGLTENGTALATPYYALGYGSGVVSFYFESGMSWGSAYIIRVQENPAYYPTPQYWDFVTDNTSYSSSSDQAAALGAKVIDLGAFLSTSYGVDLTTRSDAGVTTLSTYGEIYFLDAIPGLQSMSPGIFQVQLETPDYTKRSWDLTLADSLWNRYSGTFIYDAMTGYAGLFTMGVPAAMNTISMIIFVLFILFAVWKMKASMLSGFVDGYALLLCLMLNGFVSMLLVGFLAFCSVVMGGVILFLNRS